MSELEILRRSAVMAPVGSRVPVNREVLLSLIAAAEAAGVRPKPDTDDPPPG